MRPRGRAVTVTVSVSDGGNANIGDYTFTSPSILTFASDASGAALTQTVELGANEDADQNDEKRIFEFVNIGQGSNSGSEC